MKRLFRHINRFRIIYHLVFHGKRFLINTYEENQWKMLRDIECLSELLLEMSRVIAKHSLWHELKDESRETIVTMYKELQNESQIQT